MGRIVNHSPPLLDPPTIITAAHTYVPALTGKA